MDTFFRYLIAAFFALFASFAYSYPATNATTFQVCNGNCVGNYSSGQLACDAATETFKGYRAGTNYTSGPGVYSSSDSYCRIPVINVTTGAQEATDTVFIGKSTGLTCNTGTLSGTSCICTAPDVDSGSSCAPPANPCVLSAPYGTSNSILQVNGLGIPCLGGCVLSYSHGIGYGTTGAQVIYGPFTLTTTQCKSGTNIGNIPVVKVDPAPATCAAGMCPGQVNGLDVCVKCNTSSTAYAPPTTTSTSGTSTSPSGVQSATPTTTTGGDSSTTCTGADCTTKKTTTTSNPDGSKQTTTSTTTESKDDFCSKTPNSPLCITSTFTGDCTLEFKGTGDALGVATAEAVNKVKCALDPGKGIESVKTLLAEGTFAKELETKNKSISQLDTTNPFSSSCISDQVITTFGISTNVPFSAACGFLVSMGYVAVIFSLLYSTVFVVRGL